MKLCRKSLAMILSLVMCLGLCVPSFAAGATLTLDGDAPSFSVSDLTEDKSVTLTYKADADIIFGATSGTITLPKGWVASKVIANYTDSGDAARVSKTPNKSTENTSETEDVYFFAAAGDDNYKFTSLDLQLTVPKTAVAGEYNVKVTELKISQNGSTQLASDTLTTTVTIEDAEAEVDETEVSKPVIETEVNTGLTQEGSTNLSSDEQKAAQDEITALKGDAVKEKTGVAAENGQDLVKAVPTEDNLPTYTPTETQVNELKTAMGSAYSEGDELVTLFEPVFSFNYSGFTVTKDSQNKVSFTKFTVGVTAAIKTLLTYASQIDDNGKLKTSGASVALSDAKGDEVHYKGVALTLAIPVPASFTGDADHNVWAKHVTDGKIFKGTVSGGVATFEKYTAGFSDITLMAENPTVADVDGELFDSMLEAIDKSMETGDTIEYTGANNTYEVDMSAVTVATMDSVYVGEAFKIDPNGCTISYKMPTGYGVETVSTSGSVQTMVFVKYPAVKVKLSPAVTGATVKIGTNTAYEIGEGVYVLTGVKTGNQTVTASKTGYKDGTATVTVESGKLVEVTVTMTKNQSSGTVTPTTPSNNSTRYVSGGGGSGTAGVRTDIEIKPGATPSTPSGTVSNVGNFTDVKSNDWFAAPVLWAVNKGITNGVGDNRFDPNGSCTRGQMVTFLWRAAGSPDAAANGRFKDVDGNAYYAKAVAWAVANGVTDGKGATDTFAPNDQVTRAEAVTFLSRAMKGSGSGSSNFNDVPGSSWFAASVGWAVSNGITNGMGDNQFQPNGLCTRAQTVTFLYRAYGNK